MKKLFTMMLIGTIAAISFTACKKEVPEVTQTEVETEETEAAESVSEPEVSTEPEVPAEPEVIPEVEEIPEVVEDKADNGTKPEFGALSEDIYSFQIQINGDVYQFPMTYKEFESYGWVSRKDDSETLDAGFQTSTWNMNMGDLECYANIINFDISGKPVNECYVGGISIDDYMLKNTDAKVILPGNIELLVSTPDEVKAILGTPSYENVSDKRLTTFHYEKEYHEKVRILFDGETNKVYKIEIQNLVKPENFQVGEVSTEVPEIVSKYKAPDKISDDFGAYTIELAGSLYQLPAPLSQFSDNGWEVLDNGAEKTVAGRDYDRITLMKDNQKMKLFIRNYSENATTAINCFITELESDSTPMTITGGITLGMKRKDLEDAIANVEFEKNEQSSNTVYNIMPSGKKTQGYEIYVKNETDAVYKINADFQPKFSEFSKQ